MIPVRNSQNYTMEIMVPCKKVCRKANGPLIRRAILGGSYFTNET